MIDTNKQFANISSYTGDLEIIGNGLAPVIKKMPLNLKVDNLELEFEFLTDNSNELKSERRVVGNKLYFVLTNFSNALGQGIVEPIEFGLLNGRKLYISFWVWSPNVEEGKRLINWTILRASETQKIEG